MANGFETPFARLMVSRGNGLKRYTILIHQIGFLARFNADLARIYLRDRAVNVISCVDVQAHDSCAV